MSCFKLFIKKNSNICVKRNLRLNRTVYISTGHHEYNYIYFLYNNTIYGYFINYIFIFYANVIKYRYKTI